MKIGIVTLEIFWVHRNVGTLLQNYSLVEALVELGHDAYNISRFFRMKPQWNKPKAPYVNIFDALRKFVKSPGGFIREYKDYKHRLYYDFERPWSFKTFYESRVRNSGTLYNRKTFLETPPPGDCYICGSDQVWTPADRAEVFLDWAPEGKRIAYAVSRPWAKTTDEWLAVAGKELPYFAGVSVREEDGLEVVRKAGRSDAVVAIDPVFLHDDAWYTQKLGLTTRQEKYLFLYVLNITSLDMIPFDAILQYCRSNNLKLKAIASQGAENVIPRKYLVKADPVEFMNIVKNAACIVTNSFHGCVFSYIFKKPFAAMLQEGKTLAENARFKTLFNKCDEVYRIVSKNQATEKFSELLKMPPTAAQAKIAEWRDSSISFLKKAISSI